MAVCAIAETGIRSGKAGRTVKADSIVRRLTSKNVSFDFTGRGQPNSVENYTNLIARRTAIRRNVKPFTVVIRQSSYA